MAERRGKESAPTEEVAADEFEEERSQNPIPDFVRKAIAAGFSGFFFTEETIRKALGDTLPKEWADFAADQGDRARGEFLDRLGQEMGRAFASLDYADVIGRLLDGRTLEVTARIRRSADGDEGEGRTRLRIGTGGERERK
jgi:hypothetical protein